MWVQPTVANNTTKHKHKQHLYCHQYTISAASSATPTILHKYPLTTLTSITKPTKEAAQKTNCRRHTTKQHFPFTSHTTTIAHPYKLHSHLHPHTADPTVAHTIQEAEKDRHQQKQQQQ